MILICYHYLSYVPGGSQKPSRQTSRHGAAVTTDDLIVLILLLRLGGRRELVLPHEVRYEDVKNSDADEL